MSTRTTSIGLALALTFAAAASQAAVARFDTTSFSYEVSNGSLSWSAGDQYQRLDAEALSGGGLLGADNAANEWGGWSAQALGALTVHAGASASATGAQTLQGSAAATRTNLLPLDLAPHSSRAYGTQSGVYSLSEDGSVTFTIGWQLLVEGSAADPYAEYANAFMAFSAGLYDYSLTTAYSEDLYSFDSLGGVATLSGTWTVTVDLLAGQLGFYDLTGSASVEASAQGASEVPEPASLALFGAGLAALLGLRRRAAGRPRA